MKNNTFFDSLKCVVNQHLDCDDSENLDPIRVNEEPESEVISDSNPGFQLIDFDKAFAN